MNTELYRKYAKSVARHRPTPSSDPLLSPLEAEDFVLAAVLSALSSKGIALPSDEESPLTARIYCPRLLDGLVVQCLMGTIRWDGRRVTADEPMHPRIKRLMVKGYPQVPRRDRAVTPADGEAFVRGLAVGFRGRRWWVEITEAPVAKDSPDIESVRAPEPVGSEAPEATPKKRIRRKRKET